MKTKNEVAIKLNELEVDKWYRWIDTEISTNIVYKKDKTGGYGIWNNVWCDYLVCDIATNWIEATEQEVCNALEKECVRRYGDWLNVKIVANADGGAWTGIGLNKGQFNTDISENYVYNVHGSLYSDGVWAEPLKEDEIIAYPEPKLHWLIRNWSKVSIAIDTINLVILVYFGAKMTMYVMLDKTWESVGYLAVALFYAWTIRSGFKR